MSLGETVSALVLARRLEQAGFEVCFSTTTRSGREAALVGLPNPKRVIQFPFDWPPAVRRVQNQVRPDLFVLVETDIWPNFLARLNRLGIPSVLVNARVSPRSFAGYRLMGRWWTRVLKCFDFIGVQSESDRSRMLELGAPIDRLAVTGNLKFDRPAPETGPAVRDRLLQETGLPSGVWLAGGSTHPGEDEALLDLFADLHSDYQDLKLLLAPRNKSRFEPVWRSIREKGLPAARFTGPGPSVDTLIFLLDTLGELDRFYEIADIVFVGKSLPVVREGGGHNLLEPAARFKPMLFGPRMENFEEIARLMVSAGGGVQVSDTAHLKRAVVDLLNDPARRFEMGRRARSVFEAHQGALERTVARMIRLVPGSTEVET